MSCALLLPHPGRRTPASSAPSRCGASAPRRRRRPPRRCTPVRTAPTRPPLRAVRRRGEGAVRNGRAAGLSCCPHTQLSTHTAVHTHSCPHTQLSTHTAVRPVRAARNSLRDLAGRGCRVLSLRGAWRPSPSAVESLRDNSVIIFQIQTCCPVI